MVSGFRPGHHVGPRDRRLPTRLLVYSQYLGTGGSHDRAKESETPRRAIRPGRRGQPKPLSAIDGNARKAVGLVYLRQFDEIGECEVGSQPARQRGQDGSPYS
jgi:hypothetical protein